MKRSPSEGEILPFQEGVLFIEALGAIEQSVLHFLPIGSHYLADKESLARIEPLLSVSP